MRKWTAADTATLQTMAAIGCTDAMIARMLGYCPDTIQRHRATLGLPSSHEVRYGTWGELPGCALEAIRLSVRMGA